MRGAILALLLGLAAPAAAEEDILHAQYGEPTTRYPHGALGDKIEWGALVLEVDLCAECRLLRRERRVIRLHETRVFEDTAPRLYDLDGDGLNEVLVVESHQSKGARIAVYDAGGLVAYGPYIGHRFRWVAPIGAADLDGDGIMEIAFIDRPHLVQTLRILHYQPGMMPFAAKQTGLTNHRIGQDFISGGIRDCGAGLGKAGRPEMIVANADWTQIMAATYDGTQISLTSVAPFTGPDSFAKALSCEN